MRLGAIIWLLAVALAPGAQGAMVAPSPATAASPLRTRQMTQEAINAATQQAIADIRKQVLALPVGRMTVGQFLEAYGAADELLTVLSRADQIGSPRWVDNRICQIQLEVPASRVAYLLKQLLAADPRVLPLTPLDVDAALQRWPRRAFVAIGSSAAVPGVGDFRPANPRWVVVGDDARRDALERALTAACQTTLESMAPVVLVPGLTLGQALRQAGAHELVATWLAECPVTRVDFRDDLTVEVEVAANAAQLFETIQALLLRQSVVPVPREAEWLRIGAEIANRFVPPVGRALAVATQRPETGVTLPQRPPDWADQAASVRGNGDSVTPLKSALAAEEDALARLRNRIVALELAPGLTLGAAAARDPAIAAAIDRALDRVRITRTDYSPDGSASVVLTLDLGILWDELRR